MVDAYKLNGDSAKIYFTEIKAWLLNGVELKVLWTAIFHDAE